jgi:hypothetical protein
MAGRELWIFDGAARRKLQEQQGFWISGGVIVRIGFRHEVGCIGGSRMGRTRLCVCAVFKIRRGGRRAGGGWTDLSWLQRGESFVWLDELCRAGGHWCGDCGGSTRVSCCCGGGGYRGADFTVRSVSAGLGRVWRAAGVAGEPHGILGIQLGGVTAPCFGRDSGSRRVKLFHVEPALVSALEPRWWRVMFRVLQCFDFQNATM